MDSVLMTAELFQGLRTSGIERLFAIGRTRSLANGEYLFLLGDSAECIYVVTSGTVHLCLPLMVGGVVSDVPVEAATAGKALGWSALVKPYRFTLSARAANESTVIGFPRAELQQLFDREPDLGRRFLANLSELVGLRLVTFQALWVRELQQAVLAEAQRNP